MTIRADRVQVGDILVPVVEYGKVVDVIHGVNDSGGYVRMEFDDGRLIYCPLTRLFKKLLAVEWCSCGFVLGHEGPCGSVF